MLRNSIVNMNEIIYIKPHHFIDIIREFGAGTLTFEPHPYGHTVHTTAEKIVNNRDITLEVEPGADDICKPCRHNINGMCDDTIDISYRPGAPSSKREWNLIIDNRWCERLKIKQGDRLTAGEFCKMIKKLSGDFGDIYREIPAERTAKRADNIRKGIGKFLE